MPKDEPIVFRDVVERSTWGSVYAARLSSPHGTGMHLEEFAEFAADNAIRAMRARCGEQDPDKVSMVFARDLEKAMRRRTDTDQ